MCSAHLAAINSAYRGEYEERFRAAVRFELETVQKWLPVQQDINAWVEEVIKNVVQSISVRFSSFPITLYTATGTSYEVGAGDIGLVDMIESGKNAVMKCERCRPLYEALEAPELPPLPVVQLDPITDLIQPSVESPASTSSFFSGLDDNGSMEGDSSETLSEDKDEEIPSSPE